MDDEQLTIQLSADCIALLDSDRETFATALRNELMEHVGEIEHFLPRYCTETREDFTEGQTDILDCDITVHDDGNGSLHISFYGYVYVGCKDMCHNVDHQDEFKFHIDKEGATITLEFPYPPSRDPDEY